MRNIHITPNIIDDRQLKGDIFSIFGIAIAAAEATIGLDSRDSDGFSAPAGMEQQMFFWEFKRVSRRDLKIINAK